MKRIPLRARDGSVRTYAIVDDEDFERFGHLRWQLTPNGYVRRTQDGQKVYLHRLIVGLAKGDRREADHRNLDRLDCRRRNLRITTHAGNSQNLRARKGARSRYRGVSWHRQRGKWRARVEVNGRAKTVGYADDEREAALIAQAYRDRVMPMALPDPALAA